MELPMEDGFSIKSKIALEETLIQTKTTVEQLWQSCFMTEPSASQPEIEFNFDALAPRYGL